MRGAAGLVEVGSNPWPWLVSTSCSVETAHTVVRCNLPEGAGANLEMRLSVGGAWAQFIPAIQTGSLNDTASHDSSS